MKSLEFFLKPTQGELFQIIRRMFNGKHLVRKGSYILVPGKAPIMLVAHMDTVHRLPVVNICKSEDGNILMSPQGIGGDDRCGVYGIACAYEAAEVKPWLLFTCDEEIGGKGAEAFAKDYRMKRVPKALRDVKLLVELDRKGGREAVYYDCDNDELEEYITSKGFHTEIGSYSDICDIAPEMGVAAVNLSAGYYNAHTEHEYINRNQLHAVIEKLVEIIDDVCQSGFQKLEYRERVYSGYRSSSVYGGWYDELDISKYDSSYRVEFDDDDDDWLPADLPRELAGYYEELLDFYSMSELEELRTMYGDGVIKRLFECEIGPVDDEITLYKDCV